MKLTSKIEPLETRHTFRISHRGSKAFRNVHLQIEDDVFTGLGEAAPATYHGENADTVMGALGTMEAELGDDPFQIQSIMDRVNHRITGNAAAKAALEMALYDLVGKRLNAPLYRLLGLTKYQTPLTSFTIGIDDLDTIREKVKLAHAYPVLKVKVGVDRDLQILQAVRDVTDKQLRIDANGAWTAREAVEKIRSMMRFGIELCEQPVAPGDIEALRFVRERVDLPIFADESARTAEDVPRLAGAVDGINVKLMKCGGIREAIKMIHLARAFHMKVMIGCMIESSIAITAAAHLSPLVDYADLDGHLLLAVDPFKGVKVDKGKLVLPEGPGLGVDRRPITLREISMTSGRKRQR
ncbi:MAG: dipeptide epimerase [Acidobacteriota bacterium]